MKSATEKFFDNGFSDDDGPFADFYEYSPDNADQMKEFIMYHEEVTRLICDEEQISIGEIDWNILYSMFFAKREKMIAEDGLEDD